MRIDSGNAMLEVLDETVEPIVELLSCMVDALRWSLVHSNPDCGAYASLPWIKDIVGCFEAAQARLIKSMGTSSTYTNPLKALPLTDDETIRPTFLLVLRLLEACVHSKLLTDDSSVVQLEQLFTILGNPELPPLPSDLTLEDPAIPILGGGLPCAEEQVSDGPGVSCGVQPVDHYVDPNTTFRMLCFEITSSRMRRSRHSAQLTIGQCAAHKPYRLTPRLYCLSRMKTVDLRM